MVDTDDTRRTSDDGRRTTPRVWHKLPTGELKSDVIIHVKSCLFGLRITRASPDMIDDTAMGPSYVLFSQA